MIFLYQILHLCVPASLTCCLAQEVQGFVSLILEAGRKNTGTRGAVWDVENIILLPFDIFSYNQLKEGR